MTPSFVSPLVQRTLSAVYRFYDAFFFPLDDHAPPLIAPLEVSIPALRWNALRVEADATYRFSAFTLTQPAPAGVNLDVQVAATNGDYINLEPILLTLPLVLSVPLQRADFLILRPLWPTTAFRPPETETAIRGQIRSPTAQPVANLKVEMWPGVSVLPPAGTPFTRSNANGDFLFRFPLLKGTAGSAAPFRIRLNGGGLAVNPASPSIVLGRTHIVQFDRP
jgi:hypothetical protein